MTSIPEREARGRSVCFLETSQTRLAGDEQSFVIFETTSRQGYSETRASLLTKDGRVPYANEHLYQLGLMVHPAFLAKRPKVLDYQVRIPGASLFANRFHLADTEVRQFLDCREPEQAFDVDDGGAAIYDFLLRKSFSPSFSAALTVFIHATYFQSFRRTLPVVTINGLSGLSASYLREVLVALGHNAVDLSAVNPTRWETLIKDYAATIVGNASGFSDGPLCHQVARRLLESGNRRVTGFVEGLEGEGFMAIPPAAPAFLFDLTCLEAFPTHALMSLTTEHQPTTFHDLNVEADRQRLTSLTNTLYAYALIRAPEMAQVYREQADPELLTESGPMIALPMAIAKVLDRHHPGIGFLSHLKAAFNAHVEIQFDLGDSLERQLVAGLIAFLNSGAKPIDGRFNLHEVASYLSKSEGINLVPNLLARKLNAMKLIGKRYRKRHYPITDAASFKQNGFYEFDFARIEKLGREFELDITLQEQGDESAAASVILNHLR